MFKYMISISKNMYTDKINEKVNKYNNTYHWTIKMKPVDVNPSMHIDFNKENNKEGLVFKIQKHFCKKLCSKLIWRYLCYFKS